MIHFFDVFNGDADGLFALHPLRLAEPRFDTGMASVVMLPDADWARRVVGSLANRLS